MKTSPHVLGPFPNGAPHLLQMRILTVRCQYIPWANGDHPFAAQGFSQTSKARQLCISLRHLFDIKLAVLHHIHTTTSAYSYPKYGQNSNEPAQRLIGPLPPLLRRTYLLKDTRKLALPVFSNQFPS